jgi:hypothetical protein
MTDRDTLPIPDYDHLPLGSLESRIRTLDRSGLEALLTFESKHGDRAPVMNLFRQRLQQLDHGAKPSGGDPTGGTMPETGSAGSAGSAPAGAAGSGGSTVSPQTQGPPVNPPSHGDPTNPAQPRG